MVEDDESAGMTPAERRQFLLNGLVAPGALVVAVLGSILAGIATPTEAAGVGAVGATLLAGLRTRPDRSGSCWPAWRRPSR
jgi:TRAP-type mannitol/chloroaromatic compound transport system permease large subunit